MTREQAKKWLPMITAFTEGKQIQHKLEVETIWRDVSKPSFLWLPEEYRIKPGPKFRAWNASDDTLGKKVRLKDDHAVQSLITALGKDTIHVAPHGWQKYETLLDDWEQLDGSPCGVMEAE